MGIWKRKNASRGSSWQMSLTVAAGGRSQTHNVNTYCSDKKAAEDVERKVRRLATSVNAGERPAEDLLRWVSQMHPKLRQRLIALEQLDAGYTASAQEIAVHVEEYIAHCAYVGQDEQHIKIKKSQLNRLITFVGARRLIDLQPEPASRYLQDMKNRGRSHRTINQHRATVNAFLTWCVSQNRLDRNPLTRLPKLNEEADRRRKRRAATEEELQRFLDTAPATRRPVYIAAIYTGLRRGELRQLEVGDIDFAQGTLRVRREVNKSRCEQILPLHDEVKQMLFQIIKPNAESHDRIFKTIPAVKTLRRDLLQAGIEEVDSEGRVLDFHALRTTFATRLLRLGVPASIAKKLTRHSSVTTLERHYDRLDHCDATAAMASYTRVASLKVNGPNDVLCENSSAVKSAVRKGPQGAPGRAKVRKDQIITDPIKLLDWMKQHDYNVPLDRYLPLNAPVCTGHDGPIAKLAQPRAISSVG